MRPEYRFANRSDLPALRALWQQAFHDSDSFLDRFFHTAFSPPRSRLAAVDGVIAAALYWFPASCRGQSLAYLYAVATAPPFQGKGLCTGLMENTRALLDGHGMGGIVLVPGQPSLFSFYARMGYTPCCPQGRIQARAGGPALPLKPVSPRRTVSSGPPCCGRRRAAGGNPAGIPGGTLPALRRERPNFVRLHSGRRNAFGAGATLPGACRRCPSNS